MPSDPKRVFHIPHRRQLLASRLNLTGTAWGIWFNQKRERIAEMKCRSCGSFKLSKFGAEVAIHFLGLRDLKKPVAWFFPELLTCLDCGHTEFRVPKEELEQLGEG